MGFNSKFKGLSVYIRLIGLIHTLLLIFYIRNKT